jgi:predicted transcriptional regulator
MFKDEILENERRNTIYNCIRRNPGLHIRALQRRLGIPLASLQYHLNFMARRDVVIEEKTEHYTRYYVSKLGSQEKNMLLLLRQKRLREIVMIILLGKKAKHRYIIEQLGLPPSTVSFYIKCLLDNNVIEKTKIGYETIYTLKEEDRISKVLIAYRSSFLDKIVDKWASTWLENTLAFKPDADKEPDYDSKTNQ